MSWGEVYKINNNMNGALNEQIRDLSYKSIRVITAPGDYTPEKTGLYKVICVGAGGRGNGMGRNDGKTYGCGGGGGGVAIKTLRLLKSKTYPVSFDTSTSFTYDGNVINATNGKAPEQYYLAGVGGTASGGDENYAGTNGVVTEADSTFPRGGSVGVYIGELYRTLSGAVAVGQKSPQSCMYTYGDSLLSYGGGGTGAGYYEDSNNYGEINLNGLPGAVIIIPLEMEE
jgi:hypothetical protein